jgi:valyl-tRNA synthetase
MKVGRRLAIKLLNAATFCADAGRAARPITEPLDRGMLTPSRSLVREATVQLENYDYAWCSRDRALLLGFLRRLSRAGEVAALRRLHRRGCRIGEQRHARGALDAAAPVRAVSAVCDRGGVVWWQPGSVHRTSWPTPEEVVASIGGEDTDAVPVFTTTREALGVVRREKALQKKSIKAPVSVVFPKHFERITPAAKDFLAAAHVRNLAFGDVPGWN